MALGAIAGGLASGLAGSLLSKSGGGSGYAKQAAAQFNDLRVPKLEEMRLQLQALVQQGVYTPEQAQAILAQASEFENIETDPVLMEAQMQALMQLQETGETGMSAVDQAQLARIRQDQIANERGARDAIIQGAQSRGLGGSGLELAAQLQNQQASAGNRNLQDLEIAAMAQQNRMNAIQGAGSLGGQIGQQQFGQQAQIAGAKDAINMFNTQARQTANYYNIDGRNQAQQMNLAERQRIADSNTAQRNMQQQYNKELVQQDYNNRLGLAQSKANAYNQQASNAMAAQQNRNQMIGGFIEAGAKAGSAWDNRNKQQSPATTSPADDGSDRNIKKDISKVDPSKFLDELTGYKYNYKDSKWGDGEQHGIIAQDLQKVAPQAVKEDEDGTLIIDYNRLGGPILAALSGLNERLNDLEDK